MVTKRSAPRSPTRIKHSILDDFRDAFNTALDLKGAAPKHYGRQKWVSERYGVCISAARKWVAGTGLPDIDNLVLIADDLGFSLDELLGRRPFEALNQSRKPIELPLKTFESAGTKSSQTSLIGTIGFDEVVLSTSFRSRHNGVELYPLQSDAMSPDMNPGDIIAVDTDMTSLQDNKVYLFAAEGRNILRRVILNLDGTVKLRCTNKKYPDIDVDQSKIQEGKKRRSKNMVLRVIGMVSWMIKQAES